MTISKEDLLMIFFAIILIQTAVIAGLVAWIVL